MAVNNNATWRKYATRRAGELLDLRNYTTSQHVKVRNWSAFIGAMQFSFGFSPQKRSALPPLLYAFPFKSVIADGSTDNRVRGIREDILGSTLVLNAKRFPQDAGCTHRDAKRLRHARSRPLRRCIAGELL